MEVNNNQIYKYKLLAEYFYGAGPCFEDIISMIPTPESLFI